MFALTCLLLKCILTLLFNQYYFTDIFTLMPFFLSDPLHKVISERWNLNYGYRIWNYRIRLNFFPVNCSVSNIWILFFHISITSEWVYFLQHIPPPLLCTWNSFFMLRRKGGGLIFGDIYQWTYQLGRCNIILKSN